MEAFIPSFNRKAPSIHYLWFTKLSQYMLLTSTFIIRFSFVNDHIALDSVERRWTLKVKICLFELFTILIVAICIWNAFPSLFHSAQPDWAHQSHDQVH